MQIKKVTIYNPIGTNGKGIKIRFKPSCSRQYAHSIFESFSALVSGHKTWMVDGDYIEMIFSIDVHIGTLIQWVLFNEAD